MERFELPNGLRVLLDTRDIELCHVYAGVNVGSIDEDDGQRGMAHFLEHCIFSGTRSWPEEKDVWETIESTGGKINAYTTKDHTTVFCSVLPKYLDQALTLIGEMLFVPRLEQQDIDQEKKIVAAEIAKTQTGLEVKANRYLLEAMAGSQPISRDVLGDLNDIQTFTKQNLREFHQKHYVPSNAGVVIVGPKIDRRVIENCFAYQRRSARAANRQDISLDQVIESEQAVKGKQGAVILGFPTPNIAGDLSPLLVHALGGMSTFGLRSIIRFRENLAYTVNSVWNGYSHGSHGLVYARCGNENIDRIAESMMQFCEIMRSRTLNTKTFNRVRNSFLGRRLEESENPELRAKKLIHLLLNNCEDSVDHEIDVTPDSLKNISSLLERYAIVRIKAQ